MNKNYDMEQNHFKFFVEDSEEHIELVRQVGSIKLLPNTGRKGYILASIDTINSHIEGGADTWGLATLEKTLKDVIKYKLWDWIDGNKYEDSFQGASTAHLHREIIETIAHLNQNGLIDSTLNVTDLGREFLATVIVSVDSTETPSQEPKKV
jgi:hypothetical protein